MAGVVNNEMNFEQRQVNSAMQANSEESFANELVKGLDLPASLANRIEDEATEDAKQRKDRADKLDDQLESEREEEEEEEETEEDTEEDGTEKSEDDGEEKDDENEPLIPRSKVQKRIDDLVKQNKLLMSQMERLNSQMNKPQEQSQQKDEDTIRLEKMSEDELRNVKKQVRMAQIESVADKNKLSELMELEDKIDNVMRSAPNRFISQQTEKFNQSVQDSSATIENFESVAPVIFKEAQAIFKSHPELSRMIDGQAIAWKLAVEKVENNKTLTAGKSKAESLARQVNTLKKKVSMDTPSQKATENKGSEEGRLFKKARYGTTADKEAFFRKRMNTDSLVEDELAKRR